MGGCECVIRNEMQDEKDRDPETNENNILVKFSEDEISMIDN